MTAADRRRTEPSWCTGAHTNGHTLPLHKSTVTTIGPLPVHSGSGVASLWLKSGADGPTRVGLRVAHMANAEIGLSLEHAEQLHAELGELIAQAKSG